MSELTPDELTVLLIACEGQSMMPIGRWEAPVESLVKRGFLSRSDKFNNYITDAGRAATQQKDDANFKAVIETRNAIVGAQEKAKARAEEIAALLAELATYSAAATGDDKVKALRNWCNIILVRAKELIG
jgi:hypothetical protein